MVLSISNEKIDKSEGLLLLTAIKRNISFLSIGELRNVMALAFHDPKTAKNTRLSKAKHVI